MAMKPYLSLDPTDENLLYNFPGISEEYRGEANLLIAVLAAAIRDLFSTNEFVSRSAKRYLLSDTGLFVLTCDLFSFNPETLRNGIFSHTNSTEPTRFIRSLAEIV
jgi:mannitol-1-phosphate/altronate dehydrogenase